MTYKPDLMISIWNRDTGSWDRIEAMEVAPFDKLPERRLAVHPTHGDHSDLWTLTDVPTGLAYYLYGDSPQDAISVVTDHVFSGRYTMDGIKSKFDRGLKITGSPAPEPTKLEVSA